jgi:FixJ family two-component response regulator
LNEAAHKFQIEERTRQISSLIAQSMIEMEIANKLGVEERMTS